MIISSLRSAEKVTLVAGADRQNLTFDLSELIYCLKAGGVVELVGVERGSEESSVGDDFFARQFVFCAAQSRHLSVDYSHVEVRKFDVIALSVCLTATQKASAQRSVIDDFQLTKDSDLTVEMSTRGRRYHGN